MAKKKHSSGKGSGKSAPRPKSGQPKVGSKPSAQKVTPTTSRIPTISKVMEIGIILVAVGCPLLVSIWSKDNFLLPKETYVGSVLIVLLAIYLIKVVQDGKFHLVKSDLWLPLVAFSGVTLLSVVHSMSFYLSILDLAEFLSYFFILFLTLNFIRTHTQRNRIFWALVAVCLITSTYAVCQFYNLEFKFWVQPGGRRKIFSTFGNPNRYSGFVAAVLPAMVGYFFVVRGLKKFVLTLAIPLTYTGMMMASTRGAILGLVVSLLVMLIILICFFRLGFFKDYGKKFLYLVAVFLVITAIFSTKNPINTSRRGVVERAASAAAGQEIEVRQRFMVWQISLLMARDHPIIGQGVGTYKYHYLWYQGKFFENPANQRKLKLASRAREAHNEYVQILTEMGMVGLVFLLWLLFAFFREWYRNLKEKNNENHYFTRLGLAMGVLVILVHATVSFPLHIVPNGILLFLLMGLAISPGGEGNRRRQPGQEEGSTLAKYYKKEAQRKKRPFPTKTIEGVVVSLTIGIVLLALRSVIISIPIAMAAVGGGALVVSLFLYPSVKAIWHSLICAACCGLFLLNLTPFVANVYFREGYEAAVAKKWDLAIKSYQKALEYDPRNGELNFYAGYAYIKKKDYESAANYLKASLETKYDPSLFNNLGNVYVEQGKFEEAEQAYKDALYTQVSRHFSWNNLGLIYQKTGRLDESLEAFKRALEASSTYYGVAKKNLEVVEELKKQYVYVGKRYGKDFLRYFFTADSYLQYKDKDKALDFSLQAKDILLKKDKDVDSQHPERDEIQRNLDAIFLVYAKVGSNLVNLGELREALPVYELSLRFEPDNINQLYQYIASLYMQLGEKEKANEMLNKAKQLP